jgi:type III restriction enzyme
MQAVPRSEATYIVRNPRICGGDPTIAGTRVPVHSVVIQWQFYHDLDRVQSAFPRLDIPAIKAALAFYEAHQAEIDQLIEEREQAAYSAD